MITRFSYALLLLSLFFAQNVTAQLTANISSIDFGTHVEGSTSSPFVVTVTNNEATSIEIIDGQLTGIHPDNFIHSFAGNHTLTAGGQVSFNVTFSPSIWGRRVAKLVLTYSFSGKNHFLEIDLKGDGSENCQSWSGIANAMDKRLESVRGIVDGKMYVFASYIDEGGGANVINGKAEVFDPGNNSWNSIATMPNPVAHAGAVVVDKDIWIVGGFENWPRINTTDVQIYHTLTNSWSMGPSLPAPRNTAAVQLIGNKIYVVGGFSFDPNDFSDEEDIADFIMIDLDDIGSGWQNLAPFPQPRNHMGSAVVGGKLYCLGGQENHNVAGTDVDNVHEYDPTTDTWTAKASIPFAYSHNEPSTFTLNGQIIMAGGRTFGNPGYEKVLSYDPATDTWSEICDLPVPLAGAEAGMIGNELFVAHGLDGQTSSVVETGYKKSLSFSPDNRLGVHPQTINSNLDEGTQEDGELILYTQHGELNYTIDNGSIPSWMTINKNFAGVADEKGVDIEYTIYAAGLSNGSHSVNLKAIVSGADDLEIPITVDVSNGILPVELVAFEANLESEGVNLNWTTLNELNSSHFVVEQKYGEQGLFEAIGTVEAAGNSDQSSDYTLKHSLKNSLSEKIYYRLKMVDLDGSFNYSHIIELEIDQQFELRIFPNPGQGDITVEAAISGQRNGQLKVIDLQGRILYHQSINFQGGSIKERLNLRHLNSGIYFLSISTDQHYPLTKRFTVL